MSLFRRHPRIERLLAENNLEDEDVFILAAARAEAYGWSSTHLGRGPLDSCRWGHNDAGEDWTEDDRVRQPAWLQVAMEEQLRGQRLPLLLLATVLGDVLHHVGTYTLTVLHMVVPLQLPADGGLVHLSQAADRVTASGPGPAADCVITIAARTSADLTNRAQEVNVPIPERFYGRLVIHPGNPSALAAGPARSLVGEAQTEGTQNAASIHCSSPAWSLDTAIWAAEVTAAAVRDAGAAEPVLLTVSRHGGDVTQNMRANHDPWGRKSKLCPAHRRHDRASPTRCRPRPR
ncbi:hypothetical protein [Streptomyces sp. NPDC056921]|uniref:hypothetical protein n=1 Tax=Streptomyces sp. NPDC056921 TaxID=3345966 RepID=UPI00363FC108